MDNIIGIVVYEENKRVDFDLYSFDFIIILFFISCWIVSYLEFLNINFFICKIGIIMIFCKFISENRICDKE